MLYFHLCVNRDRKGNECMIDDDTELITREQYEHCLKNKVRYSSSSRDCLGDDFYFDNSGPNGQRPGGPDDAYKRFGFKKPEGWWCKG